jgi:hypothetical protein
VSRASRRRRSRCGCVAPPRFSFPRKTRPRTGRALRALVGPSRTAVFDVPIEPCRTIASRRTSYAAESAARLRRLVNELAPATHRDMRQTLQPALGGSGEFERHLTTTADVDRSDFALVRDNAYLRRRPVEALHGKCAEWRHQSLDHFR